MSAVPSDSASRSVTGILIEHDIGRPQAQRLAADLNLPLLDANAADPASAPGGGILVVTADGLELRSDMGTLRVDYQAGPQARRVAQGSGRKEPMSRALGLQARLPTRTVFDATAGLCRDAFLLASLGVEVYAVERNPVVGALVRDALSRATQFQDADHSLANLQVQIGDARNILEQMPRDSRPEAIYLDPMFPPRRKSSLVKKEMRILAELAGGATSETELANLLEVAMHVALRRVVLKRPTEAPPTSAVREPDHSVQGGRTTRYDVWMT